MVLLNLALLRRVVEPVQRLTALARNVDLRKPVPAVADAEPSSEAGELARTFNEMLLPLQAERREATGRILAGQEAERLRIAQELTTSVARHSGSDRAELSLQPRDGRIILTVRDHGTGFHAGRAPGSGMRGMRERAGLVGAVIDIHHASPGPGTEVRL